MVTEEEDGDGDAYILKDLSQDGEADGIYQFVEDDEELNAVAGVFDNMLDDIDLVLDNLQKTTDELAATDFVGMMDDVSDLVDNTETTLEEAMDKINSIDIDTLNSSIKGLNDVVKPLSSMFGLGRKSR